MKIKQLILKYITFYKICKKYTTLEELKSYLLKDYNIDKTQNFYYLKIKQKKRKYNSNICFSTSEVKALQSYYTNGRNNQRWDNLNLSAKRFAKIKTITLEDILKDEDLFKSFYERLEYIVPYTKKDIEKLTDDYVLDIFWKFDDLEPDYIYFNGKEFLYSLHKDAKIPSSISFEYSTIINSDGKYGLIENTTKLLSGESCFELILKPTYHYIEHDGVLACVQKKYINTDDFKEYTCKLIDLDTKQTYFKNALINTLDDDNIIIVDKNKYLQYIQIDKEKHKVKAKSKKYNYIANPIHYSPKAVQDIQTKLWGFIDKECKEIISPSYKSMSTFNHGYSIIQEDNKEFVIDEKGIVVVPSYDKVEYYENKLFFVKNKKSWAVFKENEIYIDFVNLDKKLQNIKDENNFTSKEEVINFLLKKYFKRAFYYTGEEVPYEIFLKGEILNKKNILKEQMYKLTLKEYINLFDTFKTDKDLKEAGLYGHKVKLQDGKVGYIGWDYPSTASMYDMSVELPVDSFGKAIEELDLLK